MHVLKMKPGTSHANTMV